MDYGTIGKIKKAKRYASEERDRIQIDTLKLTFHGKNNVHKVQFEDQKWQCDCDFFQTRNNCVHTRTLEMVLEGVNWDFES